MKPLKNYTAADIARYHNGEMSDAEMHALEKAALDDPFLSDALDGYVHTKTPAADVAFLKDALHQRTRKVVPMPRLFFRIAAMFILLAGFGGLAYYLTDKPDRNIAIRQEAAPKQAQPQPTADTVQKEATELIQPKNTAPEKQAPAQTHVTKTHVSKPVIARTKKEALPEEKSAGDVTFSNPHAAVPLTYSKERAAARLLPQNAFKAKVVDEHNNAVPYATVTDSLHQVVVNTDAAGTFSMAAPDSNVTVSVNAVGYQQQRQTLATGDSATTIMLQPANNALNEVVITAKKKPAANGNRVQLEAAKPVGGWNRFNTYVEENLQAAEDLHDLSEENEVVLSFDVDPAGNAIDIKVEKSLCPSCDTAAVQLIKQGAKWEKIKQTGKARARIRF